MLKGILGIILFLFCLFVLILMLIGGRILKAFKDFRKAADQAADQQAQRRRYETSRQRQQYSQRVQQSQSQESTEPNESHESDKPHESQQDRARRTQTATGETIIDHHHESRESRKIFDDSDGEYVDFTEVHSS